MSDCKTCKPCRESDSASGEYLLVKASSSTASTCEPTDVAQSLNCRKQEDTFDEILNGFIMPPPDGVASVTVCNPSIYSAGQWVQFINPSATLQIVGINDNILSLANRCENGLPIDSNPLGGAVQFSANSRFIISSRPRCSNLTEDEDEIQGIISGLEELCMPSLTESNQDSDIHPVGRVEIDPQDVNFSKCIKRIYGFFFRKGVPYFPAIRQSNYENINALSRLMINKSDKSLVELPKISEYPGMTSGNKYIYSYSPGDEKPIGPTKIFIPANEIAYNLGDIGGDGDSPIPTHVAASGSPPQLTGTFNLSGSSLNTFFSSLLSPVTAFEAELEFYIQINTTSALRKFYSVMINDERCAREDSGQRSCSFLFRKRINFTDRNNNIPYKFSQITTNKPFGVSMRVKLLGIYV